MTRKLAAVLLMASCHVVADGLIEFKDGEIIYAEDFNHNFEELRTDIVNISTLSRGLTGDTGLTGAEGPAGVTGADGAIGDTGLQGDTGLAGAVGADGASGDMGPTGPAGADGAIGDAGPAGGVGPTGIAGAVGADGASGAMGPTGIAGAVGADGATGPAGGVGATGPAGADGADGADGTEALTDGTNTLVGTNALSLNNSQGDDNTAVGFDSLSSNTAGQRNTATGQSALASNVQGNDNTAIGTGAGVTFPNLNNTTAIGSGALVSADNEVRIGNDLVVYIGGEVAWNTSSDARLKDRITPVSHGLALINDLNPVSYHRISNPDSDIEMGLLAQEVEMTLEAHGLGNSGLVHQPTEDSFMSLRYNDLMAPMIKAIQELDKKNHSLKIQLQSQQEELLAIVQSQQEQMLVQQEQIAQLQQMVEHQFAAR